MDFKNLYDEMAKTPTYGEHSGEMTEDTKLIHSLRTSNHIGEPKEFACESKQLTS